MWFYNGEDNNQTIIEYCQKHQPETIIINADTEWFWKISLEQVNTIYNSGVKNIKFIFCSFPCRFYDEYYGLLGIPKENIIHWPTLWFNWTEVLARHDGGYKTQKYNKFAYPFISLNNKSHDHRCAMIDMLAKYELIDKGIVTWNKTPHPNLSYNFKYYDNSFRGLSDDFINKLDSFLICNEQHESLLHVVGEATCSVPMISEKTILPMLYKKPFITLSHIDWNDNLRNLGFELFDEIIDYSYDKITNLEDRAEAMVRNILPLLNEDLDTLYQKLLPKLEHNYNRVWEIIKSKEFIPEIVQERYHYVKANTSNFRGFDGRYQIFMEQLYPN